MNYLLATLQMTTTKHLHTLGKRLCSLLAMGVLLSAISCSNSIQPSVDLEIDPILHQAVFKTPEDAANALVHAVSPVNEDLLSKILGADFREVLQLGSVTNKDIANFNAAWKKTNTLLPQGDKKMLLAIGAEKWTFPIPITAGTSGWHFDIEEGHERMRIRRIGRNELATMQAVLAYYDAQMEYAEQDHNGDGTLEYAQKFISTPGIHDGLYWDVELGDTLSPLGSLFAGRIPGSGYHGYFYRILKTQDANAKGGAYSYMIGKHMRAGFALIAWPDEYGESGIMSFMVSHDGIVYEQNLGPDGDAIAEDMSAYAPDTGWIPAKEVNAPELITKK